MENKQSTEHIIEVNISTLMNLLQDETTPAKVRAQASATLLEWVSKRQNSGWAVDL